MYRISFGANLIEDSEKALRGPSLCPANSLIASAEAIRVLAVSLIVSADTIRKVGFLSW